jgi:hypothetical protein
VLPLLSRVTIRFHLEDYGDVVAIGLVIMRCQESRAVFGGVPRIIGPGFFLFFEAISLESREAIDDWLYLKKVK